MDWGGLRSTRGAPGLGGLGNIDNPDDMREAGFEDSCNGRAGVPAESKTEAAE